MPDATVPMPDPGAPNPGAPALVATRPDAASAAERKRRRGMLVSIMVAVIAVHVVALVLAGIWVVAQFFTQPEATFEVQQRVVIPAQNREHQMNMAQHEAVAPKPSFNDRIVSTRPVNFALPDLPQIDLDQMLPLDPSELISDQVASLVGAAGLGSGMAEGLSGMGGTGSGFSFFGVDAAGDRIVLLFDVSQSVLNKAERHNVPIARIKEETVNLVNGLPIDARFGIIQFVRNYKPFNEELLPASPSNREAAREWIDNEWSETGQMARGARGVRSPEPNGIVAVLDAAFRMRPDVIFIISDGGFWQTYPSNRRIPNNEIEAKIRELQAETIAPIPIHFIGFEMTRDDTRDWRRITSRSGGQLREIGEG